MIFTYLFFLLKKVITQKYNIISFNTIIFLLITSIFSCLFELLMIISKYSNGFEYLRIFVVFSI